MELGYRREPVPSAGEVKFRAAATCAFSRRGAKSQGWGAWPHGAMDARRGRRTSTSEGISFLASDELGMKWRVSVPGRCADVSRRSDRPL